MRSVLKLPDGPSHNGPMLLVVDVSVCCCEHNFLNCLNPWYQVPVGSICLLYLLHRKYLYIFYFYFHGYLISLKVLKHF